MERQTFFYYYSKKDETNICLNESTGKITQITKAEKSQMNDKFFEMNKSYEPNEESLRKYMNDFNRCNDEILKYTNNRTEYKKWVNDGMAIMSYYKSKSANAYKSYNIKDVSVDELILSERCNNGGKSHLDTDSKGEKIISYGHDFSNCYANMLSNFLVSGFLIPMKEGKYKILKLDILKQNTFKYGYYKAKIETNNKIIKDFFTFSTDETYTHYSMIELSILTVHIIKTYKLEIHEIFDKLEIDSTAYVYDSKDLVECSKLFYKWFKDVNEMKQDLNDNFLVKNLGTKLWGYLTQYNRKFVSESDIDKYDYGMYHDFTSGRKHDYLCIEIENPTKDNKLYQLVSVQNPYKNGGIARIKSFLVSSFRLYMTKMIINNNLENDVVRLCTDGIVLKKEFDFSKAGLKYYPIPENKTTGLIKWMNSNTYFHCCDKCDKQWKYDKKYCHTC